MTKCLMSSFIDMFMCLCLNSLFVGFLKAVKSYTMNCDEVFACVVCVGVHVFVRLVELLWVC